VRKREINPWSPFTVRRRSSVQLLDTMDRDEREGKRKQKKNPPSFTNKHVHDDNLPLGCVAVQADRNVPFTRRQNPENSKPVNQTHHFEHLRNIEIL